MCACVCVCPRVRVCVYSLYVPRHVYLHALCNRFALIHRPQTIIILTCHLALVGFCTHLPPSSLFASFSGTRQPPPFPHRRRMPRIAFEAVEKTPTPSLTSTQDACDESSTRARATPSVVACPGDAVTRQGSRYTYEELVQLLISTPDDEFLPYPPCSEGQLRQIDTFLVAYGATGAVSTQDASSLSPSAPSRSVQGLIGIVWVPLSASPGPPSATRLCSPSQGFLRPVEGYLQVVLVLKRFRQQGVARGLLHACLSAYTERASDTAELAVAPTRIPRRVARWRLHTMLPTPATLHYLAAYLPSSTQQPTNAAERQSGGEAGSMSTPPSSSSAPAVCAAPAADTGVLWREMMRAVTDLYESCGFVRRRELLRYYDEAADGVEMVLSCTDKNGRPQCAAVGQKRPRG